MNSRWKSSFRLSIVLGLASLVGWSALARNAAVGNDGAGNDRVDKNSRTSVLPAELIRYDVPGGETIFALSLKSSQTDSSVPHDHVILVDTSASQAGAHRQQGLAVLDSCLAGLQKADRVQLFAVDTQVQPLSQDFFAPQSAQTQAAVSQLRRRVPLGATSLQPALEMAGNTFEGKSSPDRGRSIIYIGDGMSTAKLIEWSGFRDLVDGLRERHIAVNSFAVGPRTDLQLLGLLAEHTGGVVYVDALSDDTTLPADKLGRKLAAAVDTAVFYPDTIKLSPKVSPQADNLLACKLLPGHVPPIRSDRETVLLGKGRVGDSLQAVASTSDGRSLSWSAKAPSGQAGNTFLTALWNQAEETDGFVVAAAGNELLNLARQDYEDQLGQLVAEGRRAVARRDLKQAEQIARSVRQLDPSNVDADTILNASHRVQVKTVALTRTVNDEPPAAKDRELLDEERSLRAVRAERLSKEVARTIDAVNKSATTDPDAALGELKRALTTVIASNDIDADIREKLRGRLQASIDRLLVAKDKLELDRIATMERASATRAHEMATEQLMLRDEQLEQLIGKVSSLLYEGYIGNADAFERAEEVARASFELAPYAGVTSSAIFDAEAAGQLDKAQRLRYRRYDQFLAQLHQCEMAHIPFPDEPPIVYPAPEVWKSLTERRLKWRSVDLMRWNPTEEKIRRSLEKPTNVEFVDLALEDAITYLQEYHNINIWIDKQTLTDEGIALDQPITLKLAGVSLRSVLKLLLEPAQLTYVVENEVMKITTSTKAGEKLSTRVYPVADLVIPIITPRAGRGGMGMMGGMGGGMGGMGGGMMGGGMGGMMGGMGGMGMGMMNVESRVPAADTNSKR